MDEDLRAVAEAARGFMPADEGLALHDAALDALSAVAAAPFVEIGTYCGKSTVYLGAAAASVGRIVVTVDHHRGSEENQPGWEHHEADLVDPATGRLDTLGRFRATIHAAGLEDVVHAVVGDSSAVASWWSTPAAMVFIDGGHGVEPAAADYRNWAPVVARGGLLAIHDVFPDPADGGRPPYEQIYLPALESGDFGEVGSVGSLRVLRRL
ncbi:MAG: class I SAM-dependent methyltransferase [Microthrixaceae bacterium]